MIKSILFLFLTLGLSHSISANEDDKAFIFPCSNFSTSFQAVSGSFVNCINSNFTSLERDFSRDLFTSYCSNYGRNVDYSFVNCINRNFDMMARELRGAVFVSYCANYDRNNLSFSFISCANSNFRSIERALNQR